MVLTPGPVLGVSHGRDGCGGSDSGFKMDRHFVERGYD